MSELSTLLGVDGCRAGWFVVRLRAGNDPATEALLLKDFAAVLALQPEPCFVAVDMPIGLLAAAHPGGRSCDQAARALLGPRRSSVFSPPLRGHLQAHAWSEVSGLSKQSFHLLPKIREVDDCMTPSRQSRVREAHPELAFCNLTGAPMRFAKRTSEGQQERLAALEAEIPSARSIYHRALQQWLRRDVARDDILDALVLAVVAKRMANGTAQCVPQRPAHDPRGLRMEIWS
ncbi:MAG: putative RNase H-like nuclease [Planctomycetota bacterium]|jgi:predicted RNase H-like nuclease